MEANRPTRTTRKQPHTDAERTALAARLEATYPVGMAVTTWINERHAELTRLTKGPRSCAWAELADVLNLTRIRYQAGKPRTDGRLSTGRWTEQFLKSVVQKARMAEKVRAASRIPQTVEEAARAAAAAVLAELGVQGATALGRMAPGAREGVRQIAASPPPMPPSTPTRPPPVEPVRASPETTRPESVQHGPLAQAVADQAAHDDRVLAEIRERRRRRTAAMPGNDHE